MGVPLLTAAFVSMGVTLQVLFGSQGSGTACFLDSLDLCD